MYKYKFLKLNDDKTELVLIGHPKYLAKIHDFALLVVSINVKPSTCARNLRAYFDSSLSFNPFVQKTADTVTFDIRSLAAFFSLVINSLDYCNAVLTRLPKGSLRPLQLAST